MHDETKLPRWAQEELRLLRRDLAEARAELVEGLEPDPGAEHAPLVAESYVRGDTRRIPRYYHLKARIPLTGHVGDRWENPMVDLTVDVVDRGGDTALEVRGSGSHSPSLVVHPVSSNVVRIEARRDV